MNECHNQLEWSAFCYLAGELSQAEAEQFELRLADDQEAREALARAVELTQLVAAAQSQTEDLVAPALHKSTSWSTRLAWMAVGGLASLVLGTLWTGYQTGGWFADRDAGQVLTGGLAAAWSQTRIELRNSDDIGPLHPISTVMSDPGDGLLAAADDLHEAPLMVETPSWMTAAVAGLADEMDELPEDPNQS